MSFPEFYHELWAPHALHSSEHPLLHWELHTQPSVLDRKWVSGSVHCKGPFLPRKTVSFMQGSNAGHTHASPSDLTFNIPKPFISQHPYPGLKSPSHKANNIFLCFCTFLPAFHPLSIQLLQWAPPAIPISPQCHHCAPTIPLGLPHPSMSSLVSPSIPPQFSSAIWFTAFFFFYVPLIAETPASCSGCLSILNSFTLNWSAEKHLFLQKRRWHQLMWDNHDNLPRPAGPHAIWIRKFNSQQLSRQDPQF